MDRPPAKNPDWQGNSRAGFPAPRFGKGQTQFLRDWLTVNKPGPELGPESLLGELLLCSVGRGQARRGLGMSR